MGCATTNGAGITREGMGMVLINAASCKCVLVIITNSASRKVMAVISVNTASPTGYRVSVISDTVCALRTPLSILVWS